MIDRLSTLTPRERAVLGALMEGLNAEQIAVRMYVSVSTVRTYIRFILMKLGVNTQIAAVAYANRTLLSEQYGTVVESLVAS